MDYIKNRKVNLIINTPTKGSSEWNDEIKIRSSAVMNGIPCVTTIPGAQASVSGIEELLEGTLDVNPIQSFHKTLNSKK